MLLFYHADAEPRLAAMPDISLFAGGRHDALMPRYYVDAGVMLLLIR